jgi:hypothetical protein
VSPCVLPLLSSVCAQVDFFCSGSSCTVPVIKRIPHCTPAASLQVSSGGALDGAAKIAAEIWARLGGGGVSKGALLSAGAAGAVNATVATPAAPMADGSTSFRATVSTDADVNFEPVSVRVEESTGASFASTSGSALPTAPLLSQPAEEQASLTSEGPSPTGKDQLYIRDISDAVWSLPHLPWDIARFFFASLLEAVALAGGWEW